MPRLGSRVRISFPAPKDLLHEFDLPIHERTGFASCSDEVMYSFLVEARLMIYFRHWVLGVSVFFGVSGLSSASEIDVTAPAPEIGHGGHGLVQGYLYNQKPLNSVVFVPTPP